MRRLHHSVTYSQFGIIRESTTTVYLIIKFLLASLRYRIAPSFDLGT
jgi:hypothetical protein